jgi:putative transposase
MLGARLLAYVTRTVNQELLLRNEYLSAENRILRGQIKGRLLLAEGEKVTLAEIAHRLGRMVLSTLRQRPSPIPFWVGIGSSSRTNLMGRNPVEV